MAPKSQSACKCNCKKANKLNTSKKGPQCKCRVCSGRHSLIRCSMLRAMKTEDRRKAVKRHNYCFNCLAHNHLQRDCSSKIRCKHCSGFHHSLLHQSQQPKQARKPSPSRTPPASNAKCANAPIMLIGPQNGTVLLPTVCARIEMPDKPSQAVRCLMNTGTPHSTILTTLVEKMGYATYKLNDEVLCPIKIVSDHDSIIGFEHTFRVGTNDIITPETSLPSSVANLYQNIALADDEFYRSDGIDAILGMDVHNRLVLPGMISQTGQPDATNTIFGYVISGSFFK